MKCFVVLLGILFASVIASVARAQAQAHSKIESPFAEYVEPDFPYFGQVV